MMATTRKPTDQAPTDQVRDAIHEHVIEPVTKAREAVRASGEKLAEGGSAMGVKIIDQAEANLREAFAALRAAAQAKDLTDVMKIQGDYLREQGARSMTHAREIGELIMNIGKEAVAPLRGEKK